MLNTKFKAAHKCTALLLSLLMLASMAVLPAGAESNNNTENSVTVTQVSLGKEHSACIMSDGSLYTWGKMTADNWATEQTRINIHRPR